MYNLHYGTLSVARAYTAVCWIRRPLSAVHVHGVGNKAALSLQAFSSARGTSSDASTGGNVEPLTLVLINASFHQPAPDHCTSTPSPIHCIGGVPALRTVWRSKAWTSWRYGVLTLCLFEDFGLGLIRHLTPAVLSTPPRCLLALYIVSFRPSTHQPDTPRQRLAMPRYVKLSSLVMKVVERGRNASVRRPASCHSPKPGQAVRGLRVPQRPPRTADL